MARYPVSHGRSAPWDRSSASTPSSSMRVPHPADPVGPARPPLGGRRPTGPVPRPGPASGTGDGRPAGRRAGRLTGVVARPGQRRGLRRGRSPWPRPARRRTRTPRASTTGPPGGARRAGPQVLAEGHDVDPDGPEVGQGGQHLVLPLPHAEDDARLGGEPGVRGPGQHGEAAGVAGRRPDRPLQPGHRLEVVVEHVGPGVEDGVERRPVALAVARSAPRPRCRGSAAGRRRWWRRRPGAPVGQVVAGHAGDHGVGQAHAAPPPRPPARARRDRAAAGGGCRPGRTRRPGCSASR